jgi:hypothetical protein
MTFATTIVSAFMTGVNSRKDIDIRQYIEFGNKLMVIPVPKVIFLEQHIYETHFQESHSLGKYPLTTFIMMNKSDIYLYPYIDEITDFHINSAKPEKDTIDFLFVQCNKTEWVHQAITVNPFKTEQFTWIDFGIYHVVRNDVLFDKLIRNISQTESAKVSICNCWNLRLPFVRNIHKDVAWYFAGGIFGGEPEYLIQFADRMKEMCISYIHERKSMVWETNLWYLVYKKYPELFTPYLADHNSCMLQNYGIQSNGIVLVTAIFKPWSPEMMEDLYFLGDLRCPLYIFVADQKSIPAEVLAFIANTYPEITLLRYESPFIALESVEFELPRHRNHEKDTAEHIWQMHSKVHCLQRVVDLCDTTPFSYLWLDFSIKGICSTHDKPLQTFIYELSCRNDLNFPLDDQMVMPGCWSKVEKNSLDTDEKMDHFINQISWRFSGGVLWGNHLAIRRFWKLYQKYFITFLLKYGVLTWEVNFWAWLETMDPKWNPVWYHGDHNDTIVQIPGRFFSNKLVREGEKNMIRFLYPEIHNYSPMSASYLFHNGKHYLNTRYVNYHICLSGAYWWPSEENRVIRTKNILSELSDKDFMPKYFREMRDQLEIEKFPGRFSEGIEDIRIFETVDGDVCFIGSTLEYSPSGRIRMITGKYDLDSGECKDGYIVEPPGDTWCEKNWIPIVDSNREQWFIYSWHPMKIGKILGDSENGYHLDIQRKHDTSSVVFGKIRGSTCFIEDEIEGHRGLVGLVHFSEELHPRQYFHRLVLLDKDSLKPVKYTDPFYFEHLGVEFCIGFTLKNSDYVFWISQNDRDPSMITVDRFSVPKWNSCGRWGV